MYRALVCCRADMGSSTILKIKADQVIQENGFPIKTEHGNLDSLIGYDGDLVITMSDLADEVESRGLYAVGVINILDKADIKTKLQKFLETKEG